jgi:hypothetical protein
MLHPVEYTNALMIASVLLITVAGVLLGIAASNKILGKLKWWLYLSIALGVGSVFFCLEWFHNETKLELAQWFLMLQFMILWIPFMIISARKL